MSEKGILVAGHLCVDKIFPCESYPREGELTCILGSSITTGGLVNNTAKDLARLMPDTPIRVCGCVGNDPDGDYIVSLLRALPNIDTEMIRRVGMTGFTNVMTNEQTKTRTFFQYSGANALFSAEHIDLDAPADILHIGYILLLPALDAPDDLYGTKLARLLHEAQKKGLKTSIDVVSEAGERTKKLVPPALKYTDYCIINELEAQNATGILLRSADNVLHTENLEAVLRALKALGVSTWAVIHAPEGSAGIDEDGAYHFLPSLKLPAGFIKSTTGAGDAFCAGVLTGAEKGFRLQEALKLGTGSAAASLHGEDSTSGVRSWEEVMALYENYEKATFS